MSFSQFGASTGLADIVRERRNDAATVNNLSQYKLDGRIRLDRTAPSSSTDIIAGDKEGDMVEVDAYLYRLANISGALKWKKITWADV